MTPVVLPLLFYLLTSCATQMEEHTENEVYAETPTEAPPEKKEYPWGVRGAAYIEDPAKYRREVYTLEGAEDLNLEHIHFDIPVVYNSAVRHWIKYFLGRGRESFRRYTERSGRYAPILGEMLEKEGLPRDLVFLAMAESGFRNEAKSWAKAVGPWQFMSYTGRKYGLHIDWFVDERRDPLKATRAAAAYLRKLRSDFTSWELAFAAYNAGEGKMMKAQRRYGTEDFWKIRRGRYLKRETRNYVPKIMALAVIGKNLKSFGLEDISFRDPLDFDLVTIGGGQDLVTLAEAVGVDFKEIRRLNPEILRWFTPPWAETYELRLPPGMGKNFADCCVGKDFTAKAFQSYEVRGRRTTLKDVARRFRIKSLDALTWPNNMALTSTLTRGQVILLPFREGQSRRASMYADLYERPRRSVLRRREYRKHVRRGLRRGKKIATPSRYYIVQKGDSLWSVAQKTGQSMDTIIASNMNIIKHRMIRRGDKLVVW